MREVHTSTVNIKNIILEKIKVSSQLAIPISQLYDMEFNQYIDHTSDFFVAQLNNFFASNKIEKKTKKQIDIPANWFQMFKKEYFPQWLLEKFPVKTIPFEYVETIEITKICPHIPMGKDKNQCYTWISES